MRACIRKEKEWRMEDHRRWKIFNLFLKIILLTLAEERKNIRRRIKKNEYKKQITLCEEKIIDIDEDETDKPVDNWDILLT